MDDELRILKAEAIPEALDSLDDQIMLGVDRRRREAASMRRTMVFAALVSMGGGILAGSAMPPPAIAATPLTPLIPANPLASSILSESH